MRLLYFIDSLSRAGAEQSLVALAPIYADRGLSLEVAYLYERPGLRDDLLRAGARLFPLTDGRSRLGWIRRASALVEERRPDLIHTTLFEADLVGRIASTLRRVPVVSSLVNVAYGPEQLRDPLLVPWKVRAAQMVDSLTAQRVVRFHAVSTHVADVMSGRLHIPRERIDVIPRGRDPRELGTRTKERRVEARRRLGLASDTRLILAVARHEHQKGLDVLLEAFPAVLRGIPSTRLAIAGREGTQTPALKEAVDRLGLGAGVELLGARSDVPDLFCAADVFSFPSRWEGLPGALLEAMALEAPIVANDIPSVREVLGDETRGWLVPVGSSGVLAKTIVEALSDDQEAKRRVALAKARFSETFTIDRVADSMIAFYEQVLISMSRRSHWSNPAN